MGGYLMPTIIRNMRGIDSSNKKDIENSQLSNNFITKTDREFLDNLKENYTGDNEILNDFLKKYACK
jgi:hypothetical protein